MNDRLKIIEQTLRELGLYIRNHHSDKSQYSYQKGFSAEADFTANEFIISNILDKYPCDRIISEEKFKRKQKNTDNEYTWIIDPVCGTTNYLRKIPFFSHSICLMKNNRVICSAVYDPSNDEMFLADSKIFSVNSKEFKLEKKLQLNNSLVYLNVNQSNWKEEKHHLLALVEALSPPIAQRIHIRESANLELAYVACGRADAYINLSDKVWDISAGEHLIEKAGGSTQIIYDKSNDLLEKRGIIGASSNNLLREIVSVINKDTNLINNLSNA